MIPAHGMTKLSLGRQILGPQGRIAARLGPLRASRPSNWPWPRPWRRPIDKRQHLIVEAGTGVGKSFAYLVPAILATAPGRRRRHSPRVAPRDRLDANDQPAGATDRQGSAASERRDSAGIHGRAGQRPQQLPEPAADCKTHWPGPSSMFREQEEFDQLRQHSPIGRRKHARRLAGRSRLSARWACLGRSRKRPWQLPGPAMPAAMATASTTRPGGGCRTRRS